MKWDIISLEKLSDYIIRYAVTSMAGCLDVESVKSRITAVWCAWKEHLEMTLESEYPGFVYF